MQRLEGYIVSSLEFSSVGLLFSLVCNGGEVSRLGLCPS